MYANVKPCLNHSGVCLFLYCVYLIVIHICFFPFYLLDFMFYQHVNKL